jgi:MFS family permease
VEGTVQRTRKGIFINLSLFQFITFVRRGVFYTFMINYLMSLMQSVTFTTLLGTLNMIASALGQNLLWGKISDRHQLRARLILMGESIAALAYFLVYLLHRKLLDSGANFNAGLSLIFGLSLLEFFWSMSDVGWAALLTDVTTTKTRGGTVGALNFVASLGRMIGISFAGFLYEGGEGFRNGTIFYIVIAMLFTTATMMWITSRTTKTTRTKAEEVTQVESFEAKTSARANEKTYNWFLASLVVIVIGAACIGQVFLLFLKLPDGVNASDPVQAGILDAWTFGGMTISLLSGWLSDKIGRMRVLFIGLTLAIVTPLLYGFALDPAVMAIVYGLNGIAFWTVQTVGFTFAGDIIPEEKRARLLSRYNTVMALSWGPAGLLVGGPLADIQTKGLGLSAFSAYVNTFYASSIIVAVGMIVFALKVVKPKTKVA